MEVPVSQGAYDSQADKLLQDVILACRGRSAELVEFILLGGIAAIDASLRLSEESVIDDRFDSRAARLTVGLLYHDGATILLFAVGYSRQGLCRTASSPSA